jgi:fluoride exporter
MQAWLGPNAWSTFAVNISGSLVLGVIVGLAAVRVPMSPTLRDGLTVGVMGGYTTFSTFMYQAVRQFETGAPLAASANLLGSVVAGLAAMVLGLAIGRAA